MSDRNQRRLAAALDVLSIVIFVLIGRKNHDEGGSVIAGAAKVAAPFLVALVVGWFVARAWQSPLAVTTGVIIWLVTIVGGLVLRKLAFDGGTAVPFVIVASAFNLATLVGWRCVAEWRLAKGRQQA